MSISAVMIDSREPSHIQSLKFGGVPVLTPTLDFGDLNVACADGEMLVIERKTPTDLLGSIKDNRLFIQCMGLRSKSQWAYLIVTGPLTASLDGRVMTDNRMTGWGWDDIQGALLTVQELGVGVLFARSEAEYEATVIRLARRERSKEKVLEPRAVSRIMSPGEQVLCSLPGIGLERAQTVLAEFEGHAAAALSWLTWVSDRDTLQVAGIGLGTKNNVRRALGLAQGEELSVYLDKEFPTLAKQIAEMEKA